MNADAILAALDLPSSCRVDRRVPKKLLLEHAATTAADKRQINDGIEELFWIAAVKPATAGVPEYRDGVRHYVEIAVLRLTLRDGARCARLVELVHRAVPYPLLLLSEWESRLNLSAAHKRWAQNDAEKTVLDGELVAADWNPAVDAELWPAFSAALALGRQPRTTLYALYQGWMDTLLALKAARLSNVFVLNGDRAAREEALREYGRLDAEIVRLRTAAGRETQIARQVELNLELKRVEAAQAAAKERL